jgi:hypothetical protein
MESCTHRSSLLPHLACQGIEAKATLHVGERTVLDEAVKVATSELEAVGQLAPFVVTKDWGDCQVERFGEDELGQARARLDELLGGEQEIGQCALGHLDGDGSRPTVITVEIGSVGSDRTKAFTQRFRPRRGRFRPFKLIGRPTPAGETNLSSRNRTVSSQPS